jgi:hypothetical protein
MRLVRKRLILIRRGKSGAGLEFNSLHKYKHNAEAHRNFLEEHKIPYQLKTFQADFGQPLADAAEASRFVEYYHLKPDEELMEEYLNTHMISDPHGEYRYFFPNLKNTYIFIIDKIYE